MFLERLIVFVKAPRPGDVKTRLAQAVGPTAACDAYRRLVETLLARLAGVPGVELRFTPADAEPDVRPWLRPGWRALPQEQGELGDRLQSAFSAAFRDGAHRVAIIGSDCPDITVEDVAEAWRALSTHDLVLGPARDGGYWLIALRRSHPFLFHRMPWSTDQVFRETVRRAEAGGLRLHRLRELVDVDAIDAWREFLGSST